MVQEHSSLSRNDIMLMRKCKHGYTLKEKCDVCGNTNSAHPPKFSPKDKYAEARVKKKLEDIKS